MHAAAKKSTVGREGMAEGGCGGNSAFLLPNQNEASPAICLNTWKAGHHRKILFPLGEKEIRRAHNEKSKEYFSVVVRSERAVAGLASLVGGLLKKCSNFVQKTPHFIQIPVLGGGCLGASRLGMVFPRENPSIFEGERKRPLGNAEVPVRSTEKTKFSEPIFFLSPLAKGTAIFSSLKAI